METPQAAIEAVALRRTFGESVALDGVSLAVAPGRVLGLLGPNGAGKTTLVRILSTLLAPSAGTARVLGYDVVADAARLRSVIGLTGQVATVDELLTGRENLEMIARLYHLPRGESRQRARDMLEQFGLAGAAGRRAGTYSGGMRRRLDLAASLIGRPPVVFLDEPTTGLDPAGRLAVWEFVQRLAEAGTTVLLTTQYLEEADRLAHHIAVIDHGKLIAEGTPAELKSALRQDVIDIHVADPGQAGAAVQAIAPLGSREGAMERDGEVSGGRGASRDRQRITLPAPDGAATLRTAMDLLGKARITVDEVALRRPALDDVFLALTGQAASDGSGGADAAGAASLISGSTR
jgi:ABC-2 type transport system ATP-binding protein